MFSDHPELRDRPIGSYHPDEDLLASYGVAAATAVGLEHLD